MPPEEAPVAAYVPLWRRVGASAGAAAARVGRALAAAYHAVDPDVRRNFAQAPLLGLARLVPARAGPAPVPDDGRRPVVFVHGLGGHPGDFWPMRGYFRLTGRRRTYAVALPGGAPLEALGEQLATFVAAVAACNALPDGARIDVVAHSMGGLVARLALEDAAAAARVATLVTLGTPHAGTHLARWADTEHTRALRPGSPVVARLARQLPWAGPPALPRLVSFWSDADPLLLPASSARVEGANNVELPGFTHVGYLLHPTAWRRVAEILA
ncbi:MAG TPA: alpha/beta fold hydrolase [Myxococcota bacterium]|jgi:triacylglycerol esterase/lipase EstA (alpha/beta hydrolase family)|nr:alpha/beta fold hydrolase [Myxococcota bacterium]